MIKTGVKSNMSSKVRYIIFDTDMGADDAWALQMLVKAEKHLTNFKLLAVTGVNGNTTMENIVKNAYYILHGLDRIDVMCSFCTFSDAFCHSRFILHYRFQFIREQPKPLFRVN